MVAAVDAGEWNTQLWAKRGLGDRNIERAEKAKTAKRVIPELDAC